MICEDELDQALIDELRRERQRETVQPAVRQRVAVRVATATGILGLGTSVAGTTQAAAVASGATLGTTVAVGSTAPAALTALALAKMLVIGMGLGASVGLGAHVASGGWPREASSARPPERTVLAAHDERVVRRTPPALTAPGPVTEVAEPSVAVPTHPAGERSPASASREANTNPVPELPSTPPSGSDQSLTAQQALLDQARGALRRGDGAAALGAIRQHLARFPRTAFEEERETLAIKALLLVGSVSEAQGRLDAFAAAHPRSLLLPSLRSAFGAARVGAARGGGVAKASDGVTEAKPVAQSPSSSQESP
jgi:hypothetical protein